LTGCRVGHKMIFFLHICMKYIIIILPSENMFLAHPSPPHPRGELQCLVATARLGLLWQLSIAAPARLWTCSPRSCWVVSFLNQTTSSEAPVSPGQTFARSFWLLAPKLCESNGLKPPAYANRTRNEGLGIETRDGESRTMRLR